MDEIDYNDTELDNYLSRFGNDEPRKKIEPLKTTTEGIKPIESISALAGNVLNAKPTEQEFEGSGGLLNKMTQNENFDGPLKDMSGGDIAGGILQSAMGGAADGMKMYGMIKGDQFDTSAEGGGVGKGATAIMAGASTGRSLMSNLGFNDPLTQGIGAVAGGLLGSFTHTSAKREYSENLIKKNLNDDKVTKAENAETYAMEQGQESLGLLKGLRQKQLGIQNT